MSTTDEARAFDVELDAFLVSCHRHPLRYVQGMWAWGDGQLTGEVGPKPWQAQFLVDLGQHITAANFNGFDPAPTIKMAISSGVGPGKTALLAWILHFLMDTRPDCKARVTANTVTQLETVTWAEVQKWGALKLTAPRWRINSEAMYALGDRANWFAVRTTCAPENAQAFAGWHNRRSTTANFYDEGGTIPEEIFEKGRGIEVDGESFQFVFGQCSRRSGQLHRAVFGSERDYWDHRIIDGYAHNPSPILQAKYREWEELYGADSDYVRVHVQGLPPNADELQYIDHPRVEGARHRRIDLIGDEALICGVDVSGGGSAWTVARFRRGNDARSIPPIRISGERSKDRQLIISTLNEALKQYQVAAMFVDSAFGAAVVERLRLLGHTQVHEVNFGGDSPDIHDGNMRAFMWRRMKEWLQHGAIDPKDQRLVDDIEGPGYHLDKRDRLILESKESMQKRGVASPDDGDALALTFAQAVRPDGLQRRANWAPVPSSYTG